MSTTSPLIIFCPVLADSPHWKSGAGDGEPGLGLGGPEGRLSPPVPTITQSIEADLIQIRILSPP